MRSVQSFMATAGQAARVKELEAACIQAIRILRLYVNSMTALQSSCSKRQLALVN